VYQVLFRRQGGNLRGRRARSLPDHGNITGPPGSGKLKLKGIPIVQGNEKAFQIVKSIGPAVPYTQMEIDLAGGLNAAAPRMFIYPFHGGTIKKKQ
jgi:hypothetical protein